MSRWVWRWQKRTGSPQRFPQPPPPPQGTLFAVYRKNIHSTLRLTPPQHCIGSPPSCPDLRYPPTKICCTEASTQPDPKNIIVKYCLKPRPLTWQRNSTSSPSTNVVISGKLCRKRGGAEKKGAKTFLLWITTCDFKENIVSLAFPLRVHSHTWIVAFISQA